jgi:hypothetical protein
MHGPTFGGGPAGHDVVVVCDGRGDVQLSACVSYTGAPFGRSSNVSLVAMEVWQLSDS